jgi:hypothetical protein
VAYYIRKGLVEENRDFIEAIFISISEGRPIEFPVRHIMQVSGFRNWVNKLLRACTMLPDECGGRYRELRSLVTVSDNTLGPSVIVKPKDIRLPMNYIVKPSDPSERDAIHAMERDHDKPVVIQTFTPSPDYLGDDWLITQGDKLGYEVSIVGNGPFACVAKRRPKRSAFDIIKR